MSLSLFIALTGKGANSARGRNGWFTPTRVEIFRRTCCNIMAGIPPSDTVVMEFRSKRLSSIPPVLIELTLDDARLFAQKLQEVAQ